MDDKPEVKQLSFERAIEELETIVKRLEEGKVPLEESVAIYERGELLKRRCEELLRQAEARVEKITLDATGKPTGTEPLDVADHLVAALITEGEAVGLDTLYARPQGLDRIWVRSGFVPVPETLLPDDLRGRPGSGLHAWRRPGSYTVALSNPEAGRLRGRG